MPCLPGDDLDTMTAPPPRKATFGRRTLRWAIAHPLVAGILVLASVAAAAITVTYTSPSTFTTSVTPPPIQFLVGDDAGSLTDYVTAISVSTNKTYLTTTVKGVPEATLTIDSLFKIENVDNSAHTVTLASTQVNNAFVSAYTIDIFNSTNDVQDTLDFEDGSPSASFTIPAGETFEGKVTLQLATGAGANNVALSRSLTLTFT